MEERMPGIKDKVEEMDNPVTENVKFKSMQAQNIKKNLGHYEKATSRNRGRIRDPTRAKAHKIFPTTS